jgi:ATP-dependent helicase HrpA
VPRSDATDWPDVGSALTGSPGAPGGPGEPGGPGAPGRRRRSTGSAADRLEERLAGLTIRDRERLRRRLEHARRQRGERAGRELAALERAFESAEARRAARGVAVPAVSYPAELPVSARRDDILEAISRNQVVVVSGETGSGKTTQIPKMCLELGRGVDGMIGHTQPRRIAARTVAERLAEELAVPLGGPVGYQVRFTDRVSEGTLVKVMTDGILLAEVRHDRLLGAYDTVIVDEAHERSLNIDFLLGYLAQLLPRRPDLKVVVTSATIDTARFAEHFRAPVVEVSGRTYPVEIRYRPVWPEDESGAEDLDDGDEAPPAAPRRRGAARDDRDLNQALVDAVRELTAEGPGDVLCFLPGERDIRDAAEALRNEGPEELEILPLYARLTAAEQHRVFQPHRGRRVVLATNVAETSLTVPGIRYVVDSGLARISRYSHRTKVQRLPIEPVSRASADQRAGRCGRVAPGVCIRLYSDEDYESRPQYTDPEILRTNLASVILQMAAIGLGEVERFPFVQPPDRRAVADGRALLEELGAVERRDPGPSGAGRDGQAGREGRRGGQLQLTPIGRRLAELPVDPRLGRMVLEAERLGCLREVTVIAAAMSIQDPRERPADKAQLADELHRRFAVPGSDFLSTVALWDYLAGLQAELSGNQFRKRLRAEFLSVLRVREWQDVASQIRQVYRSEGVHANSEPARPELVHQALLAGLLSQVGMRDRLRNDYQGARATRFVLSRASVLARRQPPWVMAGELVETERTFARSAARIDPAWAERIGAHLVKSSFGEPWWDPDRAEAAVEERVTLYGLPIVERRRVSLARVDPGSARTMFVQHALVEGDWGARVEVLERNAARIARVAALEDRVRRRLLRSGELALFEFYDERLPAQVTSGRSFERWWRAAAVSEPDRLDVPYSVLLEPGAGALDLAGWPDSWSEDGLELALRYRWEPGAPDDGVTAEVPLVLLESVSGQGFDWNVPGLRPELVTELIRSLPKALRRHFVPAADTAQEALSTIGPADGPLLEALARRLSLMSGEAVRPGQFDPEALPAYLRMRFCVLDEQRSVVGVGRNLAQLQVALAAEVRAALARAFPDCVQHGMTTWGLADLPRLLERGPLRGYPALTDEGSAVGVAVLESPEAQAESAWAGTRRLLLLAAPLPGAHLQRRLTNETKLALAGAGVTLADLAADAAVAVADRIIAAHGGPAFERAVAEAMLEDARRDLVERVIRVTAIAGGVLEAAGRVRERADRLEAADRSGALAPALTDVRRQLAGLVSPGFVAATGTTRLGDVLRYLEAAARRLDRLPADLRRDAERQAVVERVQARYEEATGRRFAAPASSSRPPSASGGDGAEDVRFMVEELRVSLWAQDLGTPGPVSEARILRALSRLAGRS